MANEKRLIDVGTALEKVCENCCCDFEECKQVGFCVDYENINQLPTVDAVEVIHGHWEIRPNPYRVFAYEFACSVCGGWKHKLSYEHENMNYCPNCGAKMDGGNEDGATKD